MATDPQSAGRPAPRYRAALLVVSDRAAAGTRPDETADLLRPALAVRGIDLEDVVVVPDEVPLIVAALRARVGATDLLLTTGGTGVAPRDVTPEATRAVIEKELPGLCEEIRRQSIAKTIHAIGSRAIAGTAKTTLILNLPGRPSGAVEALSFVAKALPHLIDLLRGPVPDASHGL